jgi:hypothetical protein
MFDFTFNYTFAFPEGSITVQGADSLADAEECARSKALQLGWKNQVLTHRTERIK